MSARAILSALRARLAQAPSRTGSLIVSLYGDAVVPRGGALALATVATICGALGSGDGAVRTAMSRLTAEGWLERHRVGRNSFYRLAARGQATFAEASARIYGMARPEWDGRFVLVLPENGGPANGRGDPGAFGRIGSGLLVAPSPLAGPNDVPLPAGIRLEARALDAEDARRLAARAWPLAEIAARYERFLACLEPDPALGRPTPDRDGRGGPLTDLEAMLLRVLLIHEYRKILLRDPLLPDALLPADWPGRRAQRHCAKLYRRLVPASERWLDQNGRTGSGPLPPPEPGFARRFAGIS
jgi:phenylacetic acid degradation operon negative regulatory protein